MWGYKLTVLNSNFRSIRSALRGKFCFMLYDVQFLNDFATIKSKEKQFGEELYPSEVKYQLCALLYVCGKHAELKKRSRVSTSPARALVCGGLIECSTATKLQLCKSCVQYAKLIK